MFELKFPIWARAIITYCKTTQIRSTALQIETTDFDDDMNEGKNSFH